MSPNYRYIIGHHTLGFHACMDAAVHHLPDSTCLTPKKSISNPPAKTTFTTVFSSQARPTMLTSTVSMVRYRFMSGGAPALH